MADAITQPIRPSQSGAFETFGELFLCDIKNTVLRDITPAVISGTVEIDWDADVSIVARFELEGRDIVQGYRSFIAPFWTTSWLDRNMRRRTVRRQLGLLVVTPQGRTYERNRQITHIEAYSLEWTLAQSTARQGMNFAPGMDCGEVARIIVANAVTDVRVRLPLTGVRTGRPRKVRASDNVLTAASEPYKAAGWHRLYPTLDGWLTTSQVQRLNATAPQRIISSALGDVFDTAELDPDLSGFSNEVYIRSNDPGATADAFAGFHLINTDQDDPFSAGRIGYVKSREVVTRSGDTSDAIRRQALAMLERASSVTTRLDLSVIPDPRITPMGVVELTIQTDGGLTVAGKASWFAKRHTFDFGAKSQRIVCQKVADIRGVT